MEALTQAEIDALLASVSGLGTVNAAVSTTAATPSLSEEEKKLNTFICAYCKRRTSIENGCKKPINKIFISAYKNTCKNPYGHFYVSWDYLEKNKRQPR